MSSAPSGALGSMTRSVAGMGAAAAVSRAFGGLRMVVIAAVLGTTYLGNTFQASNSVSNVLFELLAAGALSAVLVPTFVDLLGRREGRRLEEVAGGVLAIALVGLGVVSVLGIIFAPQLANVLTAGVDDPAIVAAQQDLAVFLLRFFVPQIMLYAIGAVATAVLHARGSFVLPAVAPIGNTVVLIGALLLFRAMAGEDPGLDLTDAERLTLALGGTLGVAAFVGVPAIGLRTTGFRWRFSLRRAVRDLEVRHLLRLSGWAVLQHSGIGILLAAALVVAGGVSGGVVAYQFAMVVFLAPYGVVAQPIHTAVLPRLAADVSRADLDGVGGAVRWAMDSLAVSTLPLAAGMAALSLPIMSVLAFGEASGADSVELLGGALVGLAIGVPLYGGFLLLTRVAYALGDSRTPALASMGSAIIGAVVMLVVAPSFDGAARLVSIGAAHSLAYAIGAVVLAHRLRPSVGSIGSLSMLWPLGASVLLGTCAWFAERAWDPSGRLATLASLVVIAAVGGGAYAGLVRALGLGPGAAPSVHRAVDGQA